MSGIKNIATAKIQEGPEKDKTGKKEMDAYEAAYKATAEGNTSLKK